MAFMRSIAAIGALCVSFRLGAAVNGRIDVERIKRLRIEALSEIGSFYDRTAALRAGAGLA